MEIIGLGIDLVELPRVRGLYERHGERFLDKVYTDAEKERARALRDPVPFLAGRFAAKEAILKALGSGLSGGIAWRDLCVAREPSGAPRVRLGGAALERARSLGLGKILLSISHGRDIAIAQALGVRGDPAALGLP
jgi:holo-[acyl-carrier protein] synthase